MDASPQRLKQLGTFGIIGDTFRAIFFRKKLFAQIALLLVVPFSVLLLFYWKFTDFFLLNTLKQDNGAPLDADGNIPVVMAIQYNKFGWLVVLTLTIVYYSIAVILSLIATSVVAYTVACAYGSKDATFRKALSVVPKVWMRLTVTFFWVLLVFVAYTFIFVGLVFLSTLLTRVALIVVIILLLITFIIGLVYLTILSQLAFVVSVLDDPYGRKALSKSKSLLKGKLWSVVGFLVIFIVCLGLVDLGFGYLALTGALVDVVTLRVLLGIVICLMYAFVNVVGLVAFTVIYFVCKSHHQESLDVANIADQLDNYHEAKYARFQQSQV